MHCICPHIRWPVQTAKKINRMSDRMHIKESLVRVGVDSEDVSITLDWCEQNAILLLSHANRQKDRQRTPESIKLCQDDSVGLLSLSSQPLAQRLRHSDKFGLHNKMKRHPLQILSLLPACPCRFLLLPVFLSDQILSSPSAGDSPLLTIYSTCCYVWQLEAEGDWEASLIV